MTHALHSSERQDWQTPPWLLERVRRVGPIICDPATSPRNPTDALIYYAQALGMRPEDLARGYAGTCGLRGRWPSDGLVWVNPPYGAHLDGATPDPDGQIWRKDKATGERVLVGVGTGWAARIAMHDGERISLTPNRTEVAWFDRLHQTADLRAEFKKRIPFVDAATGIEGPSPNHGSVLFYRAGQHGRDGLRAFVEAFRDIARILPGGRA